jgi:hypothetical protein
VTNERLNEIYEQVIREVSPYLKGQERGLLYKAVQVILMEEEVEDQEGTKTQEICRSLGIASSSCKDDDYRILQDLRDEIYINRQPGVNKMPGKEMASNFITGVSKVGQNFFADNKFELIILTACALVGVYFCLQFLNKSKRRPVNRSLESPRTLDSPPPQPLPPPAVPAVLCLVVPASIVSQLGNNLALSIRNVSYLIDNASYFLCTSSEQANWHEQQIEVLPGHIISPDSQQDVYIRVNIDLSQKLIGTKIRYKLKENLLDRASYVVARRDCLKNLSGLESFNRV